MQPRQSLLREYVSSRLTLIRASVPSWPAGHYAAPISKRGLLLVTPKDLAGCGRPRMNSMRGRTRLGDTLLFEILQIFLGGEVAEVSSAAIPRRGLSGVVQRTASTGPAEESGIESRAQSQRRAPVSSIGRTFIK